MSPPPRTPSTFSLSPLSSSTSGRGSTPTTTPEPSPCLGSTRTSTLRATRSGEWTSSTTRFVASSFLRHATLRVSRLLTFVVFGPVPSTGAHPSLHVRQPDRRFLHPTRGVAKVLLRLRWSAWKDQRFVRPSSFPLLSPPSLVSIFCTSLTSFRFPFVLAASSPEPSLSEERSLSPSCPPPPTGSRTPSPPSRSRRKRTRSSSREPSPGTSPSTERSGPTERTSSKLAWVSSFFLPSGFRSWVRG